MERDQSSFTDPELHPQLSEKHLAYLAARGVSIEVAHAAGLASLSKHQVQELLGMDRTPPVGGLGVPYRGAKETLWRIRMDGDEGGWRWKKDAPVVPYLPRTVAPEVWHDPKLALLVVEGAVKALATSAAGPPSLALGGVSAGGLDKALWDKEKRVALHPEILRRVALKGRRVILAFDANRSWRPQVALAEARQAQAFLGAGADVSVAALPMHEGQDQGPDDFVAREGAGALVDLLAEALPADPLDCARELLGAEDKKAGLSRLFALLGSLPFQAALHVRGSLVDAQFSHETGNKVTRRQVAEARERFRAALANASRTPDEVDPYIREMNERFCVVSVGGKTRVLWEDHDEELNRARLLFMGKDDLDQLFSHRRVYLGNRDVSLGRYWFSHPQRRTREKLIFDPGRPPRDEDENNYNLWCGFTVAPRRGDWSLMRNHVHDNLCDGNETHFRWVLAYCADLFQHPAGPRAGTCIAFRGSEGTGKSIFGRWLGQALGRHFLHITQPRHLTGNFNAHLADCLLLFADEAFWAGDKAADGPLKGLLTEDTLALERKGQDVVQAENRVRVLIASNNDFVVPAGPTARRFLVLDVAEHQMQNDVYFARIEQQMQNGGLEAMLFDLLTLDLSTVNLRQPPRTKALFEQQIYGLTPLHLWWLGRLEAGEVVRGRPWEGPIPTTEVYQSYLREAKDAGVVRRSYETQLGMQLRNLCPKPVTNRREMVVVGYDEQWSEAERKRVRVAREERVPCFRFPPLGDCRRKFSEMMKATISWPDEEDPEDTPPPPPESAF